MRPAPGQTQGGQGWSLVDYGNFGPLEKGVEIVKGSDPVEAILTVANGGGEGCFAPILTGFVSQDDIVIAVFERTAVPPGVTCMSTTDVSFRVRIDLATVAPKAARIAISERCDFPGCSDHPIEIAAP